MIFIEFWCGDWDCVCFRVAVKTARASSIKSTIIKEKKQTSFSLSFSQKLWIAYTWSDFVNTPNFAVLYRRSQSYRSNDQSHSGSFSADYYDWRFCFGPFRSFDRMELDNSSD